MSSEDKYETLEKIGHGSFGVIRKVRRKTDGFIMCRKEISYLRMSQKEREQLHAEFQILSHLRHPNIVAYYHREHLKASQDLHLYMEYCGNGDLGRVIKDLQHKGQRAQESFVWSIFSQLVMALYRCHYGVDPPEVGNNVLGLFGTSHPKAIAGSVTILHRDLKPENVFLGEDNSVKLGDFGLSKMIKSHDFASTYVGTPFYMSPEICAAEKYTLKSDIWSLGCIIYELCAREPPFNAKTHFQLVQKIKDGKVPPLPDMYSPDLNQIIRDCLRVNPDRRPDTAQLLNMPVVRLMRKEKEVVEVGRNLKAKEEAVRHKEQELNTKISSLEREKQAVRDEIDASLRREWEVKARLEIDRHVNAEMDRLRKKFEEEVSVRVEAEIQKNKSLAATSSSSSPVLEETLAEADTLLVSKADGSQSQSSVGTASGDECASSASTDHTEYSLDSPDTSKEIKRKARTPFGRAQTMFAGKTIGTPMDVEMASPSPIAIASLSLSPRRNNNTKPPTATAGNIFAVNATKEEPRWDIPESTLIESDDEEFAHTQSPTQHKSVKSRSDNPFTSKHRPILSSQKSAPASRLKHQTSNSGLSSKAASAPQPDVRPRSPPGRMSKIPSVANLQAESSSSSGLARKHSVKKDPSSSSGGSLGKVVVKNNIKGRTLVELQQARAGGRPLSVAAAGLGEISSPKRHANRVASTGNGPAAVWDPSKDDMPSPFLVRHRQPRD